MQRDRQTEAKTEAGERSHHPPRVADALRSGGSVSATSWSGRQLQGTVSDRDEAGLLLGLDNGPDGYAFLSWSSVEKVDIPEVVHRRVKFLQA